MKPTRGWAIGVLALAVAGALAACQRAISPGAALRGPTYACVTAIAGKTATCMQFSAVPGGAAGVDRLKRGCLAAPGQSFGAACPAEGLIGCCTIKLPDEGNPETCFYKEGPLAGAPEPCAKDGGVWSAAP